MGNTSNKQKEYLRDYVFLILCQVSFMHLLKKKHVDFYEMSILMNLIETILNLIYLWDLQMTIF